MSQLAPMPGIPNKESGSGGFLKAGTLARSIGGNASHRSIAAKREGGIKLLEISEQPLGGREAKRRRRMQGKLITFPPLFSTHVICQIAT